MKRSRYSKEQVVGIYTGSRRGTDHEGGLRQAQHLGADALQLEAQVLGDGSKLSQMCVRLTGP